MKLLETLETIQLSNFIVILSSVSRGLHSGNTVTRHQQVLEVNTWLEYRCVLTSLRQVN